jgi:hypothetical protein
MFSHLFFGEVFSYKLRWSLEICVWSAFYAFEDIGRFK